MFKKTKKGWQFYTPAEGWEPCAGAAIIDAGDNIIESVAIDAHSTLASKYKRGLSNGSLQLVGYNQPTPDGWSIYHESEGADVDLHQAEDGGPWFYEPDDWDANEVYSVGYPTHQDALEAILRYEDL